MQYEVYVIKFCIMMLKMTHSGQLNSNGEVRNVVKKSAEKWGNWGMPNKHHYAGGLKNCTVMLIFNVLWTIGEKWVLSGICIEKCGILGMPNVQ